MSRENLTLGDAKCVQMDEDEECEYDTGEDGSSHTQKPNHHTAGERCDGKSDTVDHANFTIGLSVLIFW